MATGLDEHHDSREISSWQEALENLKTTIRKARSEETASRANLAPALDGIAALLRNTTDPRLIAAAEKIDTFTANPKEISKRWRSLVHDLKNFFLFLTTKQTDHQEIGSDIHTFLGILDSLSYEPIIENPELIPSKLRIAIIDDERAVITAVVRAIMADEKNGLVVEVNTETDLKTAETTTFTESFRKKIQVVLLDKNLNTGFDTTDGNDLVDRIKKLFPNAILIGHTTLADSGNTAGIFDDERVTHVCGKGKFATVLAELFNPDGTHKVA